MMDGQAVLFSALGSGSGGNAYFVESAAGALLVDAGFSRRELLRRMASAGCDPGRLRGALLTHEHGDHSAGAQMLCDTLDIPLYAAAGTAAALSRCGKLPKLVRTFEPGGCFEAVGFHVSSFPLSHDVETVGFRLERGGVSIGIATDLGMAGESVRRYLRHCRALVIESNYDREMLMHSDRRLEVKRRIMGVRGHLGNTDACELLGGVLDEETSLLMIAHVSRECNDAGRLAAVCADRLRELHAVSCRLEILRQDEPCGPFRIDAEG